MAPLEPVALQLARQVLESMQVEVGDDSTREEPLVGFEILREATIDGAH
jgi:hypothetical protein